MAYRSPLLRCLLLGWVLTAQCLTVDSLWSGGGDISPEEAGLTNLALRNDISMERVLAAVEELIQSGVRQVAVKTNAEVLQRLGEVQSSLVGAAQLASRLDALEQAVSGLRETSSSQENLDKAMMSISSQQENLQKSILEISGRQAEIQRTMESVSSAQDTAEQALQALGNMQRNITDGMMTLTGQLKAFSEQPQAVEYLLEVVPTRQEVQQSLATHCGQDAGSSSVLVSLSETQQELQKAVSEQSVRLEGLADSVAILADQQRGVQKALTGLPSRRYLQQNIALLSSQMNWTQSLERLSSGQEKTQQTLSAHSGRLDGIRDSLVVLYRQQLALPNYSSSLDNITASLASSAALQREVRQALFEQSGLVAAVVNVVVQTPMLSGRPSLVTGRLLGEPCRSDTDCSRLRTDTVCSAEGYCRCADGLQQVAGEMCRPYPRLTESCRASSDCLGATERSVCADGRCSCPRGLLNFNDTECRSGLGIGEPCRVAADCPTLVGLVCTDGLCAVRTCPAPDGRSSYQYRLVGGDSCSDGLLQFTFNSGQLWQYLCDSNWTRIDAAVACRSLGLTGGEPLPWNNTAASEPNFFSVNDYVCDGTERSLSDCRRVYGRRNCAADELARVRCTRTQ